MNILVEENGSTVTTVTNFRGILILNNNIIYKLYKFIETYCSPRAEVKHYHFHYLTYMYLLYLLRDSLFTNSYGTYVSMHRDILTILINNSSTLIILILSNQLTTLHNYSHTYNVH